MKTKVVFIALGAGALLSGCTTSESGMILDQVGPPPAPVSGITSTNGTLVVYSAFEAGADFNSRDPYRQEYSDYKIFSPDGKLLQRVHNDSGTVLVSPTPVGLPAGRYRVVARANGYGTVTVPVLVEAHQVTTIHLEGGGSWPDEPAFGKTNAVRLPGGEIIGWRMAS